MFCEKCGKKLEDGSRSCPYCGAAVPGQESGGTAPQDDILRALDAQPVPAPGAPSAETAPAAELEKGNTRRNLGIAAGVGAAAVLVIVLAAVLFSGVLSGAKGTLGKAVAKSAAAWQTASGALGMPDLQKLIESRKVRADMSFQFKSFSDELIYYTPELEMLEGFGISMSAGYDQAGRRMDFSAAASYGSAGLITAWFQADDDVWSIGCPELLGDKSYGLSTLTLGRDLEALGADMDEGMENMSFNLFDIMDAFYKPVKPDAAAYAALAGAIEVEKDGKAAKEINGYSVDCIRYLAVIPEEAMLAYLDAEEAAYSERNMGGELIELMRAFGMSDSELAEFSDEIEDMAGGGEMFDALDQMVRTIGDVELEVYVSDGYVMAVEWEKEIESSWLGVSAHFGGGRNYADDVSLELRTDEASLRYQSTGNHGTENGAYTDSSTFVIQSSGSYTVSSELAYDPKQASDNFTWTLSGDGFSVTAEGQLTAAKDSLFLDLDTLSVSAMGGEMLRLGATYGVKPYTAPAFSAAAPTMLSGMDEDDFEALAYDVTANAQSWLFGLMSDVPELAQLFW